MSKSIHPSEIIFHLNDRLFINASQGMSEEQAKERISGHVNPLNWIAAHTVWARYNVLKFLGAPATNPYNDLFEKTLRLMIHRSNILRLRRLTMNGRKHRGYLMRL